MPRPNAMNIRNLYIFFVILIIFIVSCTPPGYIKTKQLIFYEDRRDEILDTARALIGARYEEGGSSPAGFDCSGFTMFVYRKNGLNIPRKASSQYYSGRRVALKSAKPGDLVFFTINSNAVSHVGIYLGDYNFIHAPSSGKSVSYADMNTPYWQRRYIGAITYFADRLKE